MKKRISLRAVSAVLITLLLAGTLTACTSSRKNEKFPSLQGIEHLVLETPGRNYQNATNVSIKHGDEEKADGDVCSWSLRDETLTLKLSGDITISVPENTEIESIELSIAKGRIDIRSISGVDDISINSASGDIALSEVTAEKITANTTNGNIVLQNIDAEDTEANTLSGHISFSGSSEDLMLTTISGDIDVMMRGESEIGLNTTSGSMKVLTDRKADIAFKTLTGKKHYESVPGSDVEINANSISGSLTVMSN